MQVCPKHRRSSHCIDLHHPRTRYAPAFHSVLHTFIPQGKAIHSPRAGLRTVFCRLDLLSNAPLTRGLFAARVLYSPLTPAHLSRWCCLFTPLEETPGPWIRSNGEKGPLHEDSRQLDSRQDIHDSL